MTPEQARERILATTRFRFQDRKVLVRDVALLDLLRDGRGEATAPVAPPRPAHG